MARFETAQSREAEALCAALPAFLVTGERGEDLEYDAYEPAAGFEPLVLPLQPGCSPWMIASDGRLAAAHLPDSVED